MFFSAGEIEIYPLHITLLDFIEEQQRAHFAKNRSVNGYLPVQYETTDGSSVNGLQERAKTPAKIVTKTRPSALQALLESINQSLGNVKKSALIDLECQTSHKERILLHMITSRFLHC